MDSPGLSAQNVFANQLSGNERGLDLDGCPAKETQFSEAQPFGCRRESLNDKRGSQNILPQSPLAEDKEG